jgi:hypothetical protein
MLMAGIGLIFAATDFAKDETTGKSCELSLWHRFAGTDALLDMMYGIIFKRWGSKNFDAEGSACVRYPNGGGARDVVDGYYVMLHGETKRKLERRCILNSRRREM